MPGALPEGFADLHVHAEIPVLGSAWRTSVQGFCLPALDGIPPARDGEPPRLHVLSCYLTFLASPGAARGRLFEALVRLDGIRRNPPAGAAFLRRASDLDLGYREGYLVAVESLRYLRDPADLGRLWELGARALQPIHFLDTAWGRSSKEGLLPAGRKGLTGLGREMLAEMGRLGFILDLAHMNAATAEESLACYPGPVMCSHTGLDSVRGTERNLPASLAREVFRRGGAVGVTVWRRLLGPMLRGRGETERAAWTRAFCGTAHALAALHPGARVAVGSDRGAPIRAPSWFFAPENLAGIGASLAGMGWTAEAIRGFLTGNARAFLREALPS
jgi:microsomal dipeptidase-like Zn-dependent dipeptidase